VNVSALRVLQVEGLQEDDFWPEEAEDLESGDLTTVICNRSDVHDSADEDEVVLLVLGLHGFKHWHFHQYDGDFFPSVPHGHWDGKARRKFDPYLGWVLTGVED